MGLKIVAVLAIVVVIAGGYFATDGFNFGNENEENSNEEVSQFIVDDIKYSVGKQSSGILNAYLGAPTSNSDSTVTVVGYSNDRSSWSIPSEVVYSDKTYSVKAIGSNAFSGSSAETVTISSSVSSIGTGAFSEMKYLKNLTVATDVESGNEAFKGSGSAEGVEIQISEGVTTIGDDAFKGMNVASVSLPSTMIYLSETAFGIPELSDGEIFIGWYSDVADLSTKFDFKMNRPVSIVLVPLVAESSNDYSDEELSYVVQYKYNLDNLPMTYEILNRNHIPNPPTPIEIDGYVFAGWYTDSTYTEKYNLELPVRKDTTIYGKYVVANIGSSVVIRVNYDEGHGDTSYDYKMGDTITYWDQFIQQVLNNVGSKEGFVFKGLYDGNTIWFDNQATNDAKRAWSQTILDNMILDAKWESILYEEYDPQYVGVYNGDIEPDYVGQYSNPTYDYYTYYIGSSFNTILKHGTVYRNDGTTYIELTEKGTDVGVTISSTYTEGSSTGTQKTIIEQNGGVDGWGIASGVLSVASGVANCFPGAGNIVSGITGAASGLCGIISSSNNSTSTTIETSKMWSDYTTGESKSRVDRTNVTTGINFKADVGVEPGHYVTYAILGTIDYFQIEVYDKQGHYIGTIIQAVPSTNDDRSHGITVPDVGKSIKPDLERSFFEYEPIPYTAILKDSADNQNLRAEGYITKVISKETGESLTYSTLLNRVTGETLIYEDMPGGVPVVPTNMTVFNSANGKIYGWAYSSVNLASSSFPTIVSTGDLSKLIKNASSNKTYYAIWDECSSYSLIKNGSDMNRVVSKTNGTFYLINNITMPADWQPIRLFSGTFNGCDKTISYSYDGSGKWWTNSENNDVFFGLFASITGGSVNNLDLVANVNLQYNGNGGVTKYVGALAGEVHGGNIYDCTVRGNIVVKTPNDNGFTHLGGIAGVLTGNHTTVSSCRNDCSATHAWDKWCFVGGIAGNIYTSATIKNCVVSSTVIGEWHQLDFTGNGLVGGIYGLANYGSSLTNSNNTFTGTAYCECRGHFGWYNSDHGRVATGGLNATNDDGEYRSVSVYDAGGNGRALDECKH